VIRAASARLALLLAATSVGLALAEAAARVAAPHWAPQHAERNFWRYDPLLGWAHRPGQRGAMHHPDFRIQVAISSQGLRDREYPFERTPGRRRMLVLGDSFAWGFGVEQEEAFSELIEARHPDWEILNAGTSGWGTDQSLLFLGERGMRWRPDVVLLLFHPNDVADNAADSRYGYPKPRFQLGADGLELTNVPVPRLSWRRRLERRLMQSSYLYNQALAAWARLGLGPQAGAAFVPVAASDEGEALARGTQPDLELTSALLAELARLSRENGARFLVASTPAPEAVRRGLARALEHLSVPYRALDPHFRGRPREEWKFAHDPHWNAAGQRIAADAVEGFLLEVGVLP
jgi:hypothetical protein